jgi:hypothetical protein
MEENMKYVRQRIFNLLLILLPSFALCWWDAPHMIIMEICRNQLDSKTICRVEKIIKYLEHEFPESSCFLTAACFPDDLTPNGLSGFKVWHGILTPYSPDGFLTKHAEGCISSLINENNLHSAIFQSLIILKNPQSCKWQQSFMLRFLLHSVGDIHQPLHCIQLYSEKFPYGDLAGHRFLLNASEFKNLHHLWDAAFGIGKKHYNRPLSQEDREEIQMIAKTIMLSFPPENLPINQMDYRKWSEESFQFAVDFAYNNLSENGLLSPNYLEQGKNIVMYQIALAGYRLANLLKELFND